MAENTIYMAASKNRKLKFLSIDFNELKKNHRAVKKDNAYQVSSSGQALRNNKIRILNDKLTSLEEGLVGNIFIKSDSLFDGYHNNPELTKVVL